MPKHSVEKTRQERAFFSTAASSALSISASSASDGQAARALTTTLYRSYSRSSRLSNSSA